MKKFMALILILASLVFTGCGNEPMADTRYSKAKAEILTRLKDPDSYKVEYVKYNKKFKDLYKIKFRSKNGFGAMDISYAYAFFDKDGNLKDLFLQENENPITDSLVKD